MYVQRTDLIMPQYFLKFIFDITTISFRYYTHQIVPLGTKMSLLSSNYCPFYEIFDRRFLDNFNYEQYRAGQSSSLRMQTQTHLIKNKPELISSCIQGHLSILYIFRRNDDTLPYKIPIISISNADCKKYSTMKQSIMTLTFERR